MFVISFEIEQLTNVVTDFIIKIQLTVIFPYKGKRISQQNVFLENVQLMEIKCVTNLRCDSEIFQMVKKNATEILALLQQLQQLKDVQIFMPQNAYPRKCSVMHWGNCVVQDFESHFKCTRN